MSASTTYGHLTAELARKLSATVLAALFESYRSGIDKAPCVLLNAPAVQGYHLGPLVERNQNGKLRPTKYGKLVLGAALVSDTLKKKLFKGLEISSRSGCLKLQRSRATGTMVGLYRSAESFEEDLALPYTTVCEDHGTLASHATRALAEAAMPAPHSWCDDCHEAHPELP